MIKRISELAGTGVVTGHDLVARIAGGPPRYICHQHQFVRPGWQIMRVVRMPPAQLHAAHTFLFVTKTSTNQLLEEQQRGASASPGLKAELRAPLERFAVNCKRRSSGRRRFAPIVQPYQQSILSRGISGCRAISRANSASLGLDFCCFTKSKSSSSATATTRPFVPTLS